MGGWFTKNLGDAMLASESLGQINEVFLTCYRNSNRSKELAVFIRHESEGRLHCEAIAYFSPATYKLASAVGAAPCEKPMPYGLNQLIGSEDSWPVLFPVVLDSLVNAE